MSDEYTIEWRLVPDFPEYEISSAGDIRRATDSVDGRKKRGTPLKGRRDRYGCMEAVLTGAQGRRNIRVSRLVARAFIGECPPQHRLVWLDDDSTNHHLSNLAYRLMSKYAEPSPDKPVVKVVRAKPKQTRLRGKWQRLLEYYQQTLAAPDASPAHRAIASAGLRAIQRRYKPGKRLTVIPVDETTVPAWAMAAEQYELVS